MNLKSQKVFVFFGLFYSGFICADKSYSKVSNSPNKYGEIEVIEVTAQKKVEQLHDVPLSVGVLGKNDIATHASNNIEQLQTSLPSISYRKGNTNRNSA